MVTIHLLVLGPYNWKPAQQISMPWSVQPQGWKLSVCEDGVLQDGLNWMISIDWFKGNVIGKSHISWENLWFQVKIFPSTNPLMIIFPVSVWSTHLQNYFWQAILCETSFFSLTLRSYSFLLRIAQGFSMDGQIVLVDTTGKYCQNICWEHL